MASSQEFVDYVNNELSCIAETRCKKMFGDYGVYIDDVFIGLIWDNELYIKKTDIDETLSNYFTVKKPFSDGNPSFLIEQIENSDELVALVSQTLLNLKK